MAICLIVDEAPVIQKVVSRVVQQTGHTCECFGTAGEAGAWIAANGLPDLMLVGVPAGGDEAIALIAEVRGQGTRRAPIILAGIVGRNLGLMTRCYRAGSNGFVDKPFVGPELEDVLAEHLKALESSAAAPEVAEAAA